MENIGESLYKKVLDESTADPNILGLVLTGSRGKGMITKLSDYDVLMIVKDSNIEECKTKFESFKNQSIFDLSISSLSEFTSHAEYGSDSEWDRYNFTHLTAQIDKSNIQDLINTKGKIPSDKIHEIVENNLGGYFNYYYRAFKNNRDKNLFAARLDACESVLWFLSALFAANGRVRPFNKYLEWEFKNFPLEKSDWSSDELLSIIKTILDTSDINVQTKLLEKSKSFFYNNGFTQTIKDWDGII